MPTEYADTSVQPAVSYSYRVRAYTNSGGYTAYSNLATQAQSIASAPSDLRASASGMALTLTWTHNALYAEGYEIERKRGAGGTFVVIGSSGGTGTNFTDWAIEPAVTYYYRVRAYTTAGGYTAYSNEVGAMQGIGAPSGLVASAPGVSLRLTWIDNAYYEAGFKVERKAGSAGVYGEIATLAANVTTYDDPSVQPGQTYFYRVRAYDSSGRYTSYSNEAAQAQSSTAAPSGLTTSLLGSTWIRLSWTDNTPDESGFKIERKTGAAGTYAEIGTAGPNVVTFDNSGLSVGTAYYYRVKAFTAAGGYTAYSNETYRVTCSTAQTFCSAGYCANLSSDRYNCGACGRVCSAGYSCSSGQCVRTGCPSGYIDCGNKCVKPPQVCP